MRRFKQTIILLSVSSSLLFAEQSVYGNNGFYSSDKVISKNKKTIFALQQKIREQNERIDGLKSVVEGLSATVNELQQSTRENSMSPQGDDNSALLKELGTMIDKINSDYVTKDELQKALQSKSYIPATNVKKQTKITQLNKKEQSLEGKSTSSLYSEGVRLFVKKRYDEAKKRFIITDTKGYKPAASNYYLGEISYYTKKYEDAIFHYKKSAGLNDQASYIDTLLLHTAVSLEKNGDKEQAKIFYENIVSNYSGKKSAKIAKEKLKKL